MSVAPVSMSGSVAAPGKTACWARSRARNISVSMREARRPGRPPLGATTVTAGSSITRRSAATRASMSSPGNARTSRRASASAGMTLLRNPPWIIVGAIDVRSIES